MYLGDFSDWSDVQREFRMNEPEPDEVLYAEYDTRHYEGYASVLYRRGHTYYLVEGSHCSCYGLEDQWKPEEFDPETLEAWLKRKAK